MDSRAAWTTDLAPEDDFIIAKKKQEGLDMLRKKMIRKCTAVIITGALTIAMAATVMAAPRGNEGNGPGGGNGGPMQGGQRFEMQQRPGEGEPPEFPDGEQPEFSEGERPEVPDGEMTQFREGEPLELPDGEQPEHPGEKGERGKGMKCINTTEIKAAIEALKDDDVKSDLEGLLSDYEEAKAALESAMENKEDDLDSYRTAEMDTMKTLMEALEEAGIDIRPKLPEGEEGNKPEPDNNEVKEDRQIIRDNNDNEQYGNRTMQSQGNDQRVGANNSTIDDDSVEGAFAKIINWFRSFLS